MLILARYGVRSDPRMCTAFSVALMFGASGCRTPVPNPEVEATISESLGWNETLAFRVDGGPLDELLADESLPLREATHRAVTFDPGLQVALARVQIALADAHQARLLQNPILDVVLRFGPGKPQIEASLAQELLNFLQLPRRASAADHRLRQAAADAVTVALDVVADLGERYAAVQAGDQLVALLQGRLDLLRKLVEVSRDRLEFGEGIRGDLTTIDAQRVELEVELADARLRQREDRLRLARLIGEPSSTAVWVLDPWTPPDLAVDIESAWVNLAMVRRPEIQSVAWQLAALGDERELLRFFPWSGTGAGLDAARDGDWFAGPAVSAPIPIFDRGQARAARATAEQIEARHELTLTQRKVVEEVRIAFQSFAANRSNLDRIRQELVPLQQQRRQQAEDAYRAGQTDVTPLYLAEQDLRATQAKAIEVERQTTLALIGLQRAAGGPGVAPTADSPESDVQETREELEAFDGP